MGFHLGKQPRRSVAFTTAVFRSPMATVATGWRAGYRAIRRAGNTPTRIERDQFHENITATAAQ